MITPEDLEIYLELKELPDFHSFPIPKLWYEVFKIPLPKAISTKEFIASGYVFQRQYEHKDLPPLFINEPQDGGRLLVIPAFDEIPVEIIQGIPETKESTEETESLAVSLSETHISAFEGLPLPSSQS